MVEIPTPYRHPVFQRVASSTDRVVDFFYLSDSQRDRFWNADHFKGLSFKTLPGYQLCIQGHHTFHFNCHVSDLLMKPEYDAYVLGGYAQPALLKLLRHCWKKNKPYTMMTESHLGKPRRSWLVQAKQAYLERVYGRSTANLVASSAAKNYVLHYGAPAKSTCLFPNSIDGPEYGEIVLSQKSKALERRKALGIEQKTVVLFVGTLMMRKGVDLLFEAYFDVCKDRTDTALVLLGAGSMQDWAKNFAKRKGIEKQVFFEGFVQPEDLPRYYAMSDIFVLPSRQEPFGAVVCEAAAAGLPLVVSDAVGAASDFVHDEKNGFQFVNESQEMLARKLGRLILDSNLRKEMGKQSRAVMTEWTHERLAHSFNNAVNFCLEGKV